MRRFLRSLFAGSDSAESSIQLISQRHREFAQLGDDALRAAFARADDLLDSIAVTASVASRVLGVAAGSTINFAAVPGARVTPVSPDSLFH